MIVGVGDGEPRRVSLVTSLEVKFSKGTLFRSMIESRSRSDVLAFHKKYVSSGKGVEKGPYSVEGFSKDP